MLHTRGGILLATVIGGLAFGFTIARIGFADFGEVNKMFTFQDLRMLLSFAGGVAIIAVVFLILRIKSTGGRIHPGVIPGAVLFGTGWALSGGCPAIPLVQVATGYVPAIFTIAGIVVGVRLCRWANGRYLHLDRGSCGL